MNEWKSIRIYPNQIEFDTGSGTLIHMPHNSDYDGYVFWHPSKLVREERFGGKRLTFSYTDKFIFHLKKYGNGRYNYRDIISEKDITAADIEEAFCNNCDGYNYDEPIIYTPEKLTPENATVDESLIDND